MENTKSMAIVARDKAVIAPCQRLAYYPLVIESAEGAVLKDVDGKEYIDFLSSASSLNMGSNNPVVTDAIKAYANSSEKDLNRLSEYAEQFHVVKALKPYLEVLL